MLTNNDIASKFEEIANLLEVTDANRYRVRAYRNAARITLNWQQDLAQMVKENIDLTILPGIGKDLAQKIVSIVITGSIPLLEELKKKTSKELCLLLNIPGLGPKKITRLTKELGIKSINDLEDALEHKILRTIPGFGIKTEKKLYDELLYFKKTEKRINHWQAEIISRPIIKFLEAIHGVIQVAIAGSFRRGQETVGDLDILVSAANENLPLIREQILHYPEIKSIIAKGDTKVSFYLSSHLQIDVRIITKHSFGAALQYFTGSKLHNIAVRGLAKKKNLLVNEYGVFKNHNLIASKTEKEIYQAIGLPFIEPELRENRGEIEAGLANKLPKLILLKEIKGDLHVHTNKSDGQNSLEEMCAAYQNKGYKYIAITDHSKSQKIAHGLSEETLFEQIKLIDKLNENLADFRILKSCEIDILEDGSLDFNNNLLKELDLRICSIHSHFYLSKEKQTQRIAKAMDNPYFNIFAHPTGRLLGKRKPYEVDIEKLMLLAKDRGCVFELNSQYQRLDLNDVNCKMAKEIGLKISLATDAHSFNDIEFMTLGIIQARRGWLEADDIINTFSLEKLLNYLNRI